MRIFKIVLWMGLPLFVFAQSYGLKTYINHAQMHNANIKAKEIAIQAKDKQIDAANSAYWPTLDLGGNYSFVSPKSLVSPGQTGTLSATLAMSLYDGGRKDAIVQAKKFERQASEFEKEAFAKSVTLEIIRHYYTVFKFEATLKALVERSKELKAQINRVKKFKSTGLATQEEVDKLQSVYDNNAYTIANTKLALERSKENLKLISGLSVRHLRNSRIKEPKNVRFEIFDAIKIMQANTNAVEQNAKVIDAGYMPQVNISDAYSKSHYKDLNAVPGLATDEFLVDHQNRLMLSVNMRLFDHGKIAKESEAVRYQKLALFSQIDYATKEQKMNFKLAAKNLKTIRSKLKSAKSALKAAKSTYHTLRKEFEAGLVDNIAYLDALTQRTLAYAQYKETVYDYEIAKSLYYYYAGKSPKEFVR